MSVLLFMRADSAEARQLRELERQRYLQQVLAEAGDPTPETRRVIVALHFNRSDQDEARALGDTAEELRLMTEAQQLQATLTFRLWEENLQKRFGAEVGRKLAHHQVEVGMRAEHLLAAFGTAEPQNTCPNPDGTVCLRYGTEEAGSCFELSADLIVTKAVLGGGMTFPAHVYDWPGLPI